MPQGALPAYCVCDEGMCRCCVHQVMFSYLALAERTVAAADDLELVGLLQLVLRRAAAAWVGSPKESPSSAAVLKTLLAVSHCVTPRRACGALQGLWPNYIKVVPSIAIAFVTYEKLKEGLGVELRISS